MQPLIILPTECTPAVNFDPQKNIFEVSGESRPENAKSFFDPILTWVKNFSETPIDFEILISFKLDYFSSTSAKYIANLLAHFERMNKNGVKMKMIWYYRKDDIQIKESGEQFQKILTIPFIFEKIED